MRGNVADFCAVCIAHSYRLPTVRREWLSKGTPGWTRSSGLFSRFPSHSGLASLTNLRPPLPACRPARRPSGCRHAGLGEQRVFDRRERPDRALPSPSACLVSATRASLAVSRGRKPMASSNVRRLSQPALPHRALDCTPSTARHRSHACGSTVDRPILYSSRRPHHLVRRYITNGAVFANLPPPPRTGHEGQVGLGSMPTLSLSD